MTSTLSARLDAATMHRVRAKCDAYDIKQSDYLRGLIDRDLTENGTTIDLSRGLNDLLTYVIQVTAIATEFAQAVDEERLRRALNHAHEELRALGLMPSENETEADHDDAV